MLLENALKFLLDTGTPIDTNAGGTGCEIPAPPSNQPEIRLRSCRECGDSAHRGSACTSLVSIGNQGKHVPIYKK